jgi:heme/copper-type cytochrome/quinol oxidase subunit 2
MDNELPDSAEAMEAKATAHDLPIWWVALLVGLVAWGVFYLWAYSPWSTGWTQAGEMATTTAASTNITNTVLFTAVPAMVLLAMFLAMARRKPAKK